MTPQAQRIAVATACGWKPHPDGIHYYKGDSVPFTGKALPNYLTDLNAMHEVEQTLTTEQRRLYANEVLPDVMHEHFLSELIFATASQRAEAFLRTLDLWKD